MLRAIIDVLGGGDHIFAVFIGDVPIYPFRWFVEEIKERLGIS